MSSLFDQIDEKTLAGADFVADVTGEVRRAFDAVHETCGLTQKAVADRLSVSKSAVHRCLHGDANMTLRTLGELAWAMGCDVVVKLQASTAVDAIETVETKVSEVDVRTSAAVTACKIKPNLAIAGKLFAREPASGVKNVDQWLGYLEIISSAGINGQVDLIELSRPSPHWYKHSPVISAANDTVICRQSYGSKTLMQDELMQAVA